MGRRRQKRSYVRKEEFSDASNFLIVCEGADREVKYFRSFDTGVVPRRVNIVIESSTLMFRHWE